MMSGRGRVGTVGAAIATAECYRPVDQRSIGRESPQIQDQSYEGISGAGLIGDRDREGKQIEGKCTEAKQMT
jgi:hypothetical protein